MSVLIGSAAFDEKRDQGVAFVLDLTERKGGGEGKLGESERRYREAQEELARPAVPRESVLKPGEGVHFVIAGVRTGEAETSRVDEGGRDDPPPFHRCEVVLAFIFSANTAGIRSGAAVAAIVRIDDVLPVVEVPQENRVFVVRV